MDVKKRREGKYASTSRCRGVIGGGRGSILGFFNQNVEKNPLTAETGP